MCESRSVNRGVSRLLQRSRFLLLAFRSSASGDENGRFPELPYSNSLWRSNEKTIVKSVIAKYMFLRSFLCSSLGSRFS